MQAAAVPVTTPTAALTLVVVGRGLLDVVVVVVEELAGVDVQAVPITVSASAPAIAPTLCTVVMLP
jgi:hypothetical protein